MWNSFKVSAYEGMIAETVGMTGHDGKTIRAYYSRPLGVESFPGIVLIPHMPGWDEWCRETARRFTAHGYGVICPNIYEDFGDGTPSEVADRARTSGGVSDKSVMGDVSASLSFLRSQVNAAGKVGVIGMCSGGRHTFLAAATLDGIDAAVDCWGGSVICPPERLSPAQPVAPVDYADGTSHKVNEGVLLEATPEGRMIFHNGTDRASVLFASTFALFEAIARFGLTEAYDEYFRREMEIKHKEETDENGNQ